MTLSKLPNIGESFEGYTTRVIPILKEQFGYSSDKALSICSHTYKHFQKSEKKSKPELINHFIKNTNWAILPSALEALIKIGSRENADLHLNALLARDGEPLQNSRNVITRGNTAIIPINGPIFAKANLMTEISGATSTEILLKDFTVAMDSPEIDNIIFDIDSEGGDVNGISDLSDTIFNSRNKKNIVSFIRGTGASAAFWLATSSSKVFASKTALIGSIGVITTFTNNLKVDGTESVDIVSSISPNKNIDPTTDNGRAQVQAVVDSLGEIFANAVSRNRSVELKTVLTNFGQGGVFVGEEAASRNMIDGIKTLEDVIQNFSGSLSADSKFPSIKTINNIKGEVKMDLSNITLDELRAGNQKLFDSIFALGKTSGIEEGVRAENTRLQNIEKLVNTSNASIVNKIKFDSELSEGDVALAIVEADNKKAKAIGDNVHADGDDLAGVVNDLESSKDTKEVEGEKRRATISNIVAGGNKTRKTNTRWGDKLKLGTS